MFLVEFSLFLNLSGWVIRLVMIPVVAMRQKNSATCLAWLAVIFVMPWLGLITYLLLGEQSIGFLRVRRRMKRHKAFDNIHRLHASLPEFDNVRVRQDYEILLQQAEHHGGMPLLGGNKVMLLADIDDVVRRLVQDIDQAKHHVHLLFYIFRDDAMGRIVGDALVRAAGRGVRCRVLADMVGSRGMFSGLGAILQLHGVQVVAGLSANPLRMRLARLDIRNHRKLAVIDGSIAYTGSQNIVEPVFGHRKAGAWHDVMVRIEGPSARQLQAVFLEDWYLETGEALDCMTLYPAATQEGEVALQVVPTGPDKPTEGFQDLLILAINFAQRKVVITSPYFIPNEGLLTAMRLAVSRGVEVDLILPQRSDHPLVDLASYHYCGILMEHGANVYLFHEGMLHAKLLRVDDTMAMIGSANFDIRSFYLNLEVVLFLFDQEFLYTVRQLQSDYRSRSHKVDPATWARRPFHRRLLEAIAKVFSPLL
ncbi:cardiolipin synthase [Desulfonatronum thiosulfatophilum]|uniref:Cardiolipin synthase n=1 Tax=Desulfonatronum thiosulfatophilum TaxID=617002 RepID=A0A1G6ENV0_9BACT|nr:cardiolipin synthase [Desulfonatronum thiosulfatophilum]SDB59138.1 cardiolipin synthase [Desulfonatronum thiosulfatophilum]